MRIGLRHAGVPVALSALSVLAPAQADAEDSEVAPASDFMDTRLTFTFGDDDVLVPEGDRLPLSPLPGFGDREAYQLFFDNLDTRFTGRENLTHLVLYREMPAFAQDWTTEAALVMRLDLDHETLSDTGSYIRIRYNPWLDAPDDGLSATLFPLDGDRLRLGYLYDLSFGGTEFIPRRSVLRSPALELQLDRDGGSYFIGFKAVPTSAADDLRIPDNGTTAPEPFVVRQMQYSVLAGAGWDLLSDTLRVDASAGFFQQGELALAGYPSEALFATGAAARIAYHRGIPLGRSIDLSLYRNDPNRPLQEFVPATYVPGALGWLISVEGAAVVQRVADLDAVGALTTQTAIGGALIARLQYDYLRVELTSLLRNTSFILRNTPGYLPFSNIPDGIDDSPEIFWALSGDYHFPEPHLTLGVSGGLSLPATLADSAGTAGPADGRVVVVTGEGQTKVLRPGTAAGPVFAARALARVDVSEMLWAMLWVQYVRDPNATPIIVRTTGGSARLSPKADQLGFGVSIATRY